MEPDKEEFTWSYKPGRDEYVPDDQQGCLTNSQLGQLRWLESKTEPSEYHIAFLKKLKEIRDGKQ